MDKRLIHLFKSTERYVERPGDTDVKGYRDDCWVTVNAVYDDGTWEPLFKYNSNSVQTVVGVKLVQSLNGMSRVDAILSLKRMYYSKKIKFVNLLV